MRHRNHGDKHLLRLMKELVAAKTEYDQIAGALKSVRETGYGLVSPTMAEMTMEAPEIVRQGGQFGIRLKAHAPSLHLIRVDIETEVTPTVGTEEQSEELARQMSSELESDPQKMWAMSFFGKPLSDMVREGLNGKLMRMPCRCAGEGAGDADTHHQRWRRRHDLHPALINPYKRASLSKNVGKSIDRSGISRYNRL